MNCIYAKSDVQSIHKFTIFSVPKAFIGHIGTIQYNAIISWTLLKPKPEIFLFGNETGIAEVAKKLDLIHVPEVKHNEYGTPLLDSIFANVHQRASHSTIVYLNTDIILTGNFSSAVQSVTQNLKDYLLIGRRWNMDRDKVIEFDVNWESALHQHIKEKGYLADRDCKDYFVFPKHLFAKIPPFAVGRGYWDTWMVRKALTDGVPLVDASLVITAIHQNHPYLHIRGGRNEAYMGKEAQINQNLGNLTQPGNISYANYQLKPDSYRNLPRISIVIYAKNHNSTVEKSILSVLTQDCDNYEIIVIDTSPKDTIKTIVQSYENQIRYLRLEKHLIKNTSHYDLLKIAQGEFITFLDENSILLPGVLSKQIAYFEKQASTLDILLSGCKIIKQEKVIAYQPWEDLPDIEYLSPGNIHLVKELLREYSVILRRSRLSLVHNLLSNLNQKLNLTQIVLESILSKGCKANWFKVITQIHNYP